MRAFAETGSPIMRKWEEPKKPKARIEIIPMIDVMMFLLVFFVLLSLNVIPALGVKTALPSSGVAQDLKAQKNAIITLAATGELQLDGKDVVLEQLAPKLRAMQKPNEKLVIIVNADRSTEFQRVIDVMDALKGNGFEAISFATKKK
ncbi:ExbD/TolR family protein [Chitinimonas lacunae]|uniref:ExbD/TolR family protein n=1 Tax=Chitinimonas lacunae TaxID=1963018 RepID=A0ABV8MPJ6_9NEIS